MISFKNDYSEGAHPAILQSLVETNILQTEGYGGDPFTAAAIARLKAKIERDDVEIHLLPGGTQTNLTALAAFLRPHEAAIAAHTGHILVHETGAIEATGHKVLAAASGDGKLTPALIQAIVDAHTDEHMVKPRLVYISNSTEIGSIYTKKELAAVSACCRRNELLLYLDGARLGSALTAAGNDLTLHEISRLVDAFYIGATKNGALIGEALVICREALQADFRYHMKQKGALLAKGRLLGLQFNTLFADELFFDLARHANAMAGELREALLQAGYRFLTDSPTNQLFPILPNALVAQLEKEFAFYRWEAVDEQHTAIRLVTSWATSQAAVAAFVAALAKRAE